MGLDNVFKKAAVTAIKAFGDVARRSTYTQYGETTYNDITHEEVTAQTDYNVKIIYTDLTVGDMGKLVMIPENEIVITDTKALIAYNELPIKPKPEDKVIDLILGEEYTVIGPYETDPATALLIIYLRKL